MKDGNNKSGTNKTTCPLFDEIDEILGTRAASCPPRVVESRGVTDVEDDSGAFE